MTRMVGVLRMRRGRLHWLVLVAACLSGCGGASFANDVYDDGVTRYRVGPRASGFSRVELEGNDLAWHHHQLGTISVKSTCTEYEDVPEEALVNHLLFGMRERAYRTEETLTLDGRGAHHVVVDVELDGVPLTLEIYLVKKDGCVYDLVRVASRPTFEAGRDAFARFVAGFAVLATRLD
jgi:hypothetical protein